MKTKNPPSSKQGVRYFIYGLTLTAIVTLVIALPYYRPSAASSKPALQGHVATGPNQANVKEALQNLLDAIESGAFEMMSGAGQNTLLLRAEMKYEGGVLKPVEFPVKGAVGEPAKNSTGSGQSSIGESPLSALANPLVNNPAADATAQNTQSETTIVLGSGMNVISSFNDSGSFVPPVDAMDKFTGFSRTTNMGTTWTDGGTLPTNASGDSGDPVLARNNTTSRTYLATLAFAGSGLRMFRSDDDFATVMPPVEAFPGFGGNDFIDKEWIAVDNTAGAGQGNVYVLGRNFAGGGGGSQPSGIYIFRSTDNGNTFAPAGGTIASSLIVSGQQGAFVAVAPDHSVHAFWFNSSTTPREIRVRKSTDQGVTFGAAVTVTTLLGTGSNGDLGLEFRSNSFPHAAVNPVNGNVYVVYNDNPAGADRGDVFFRQSTDGGATWGAATRVNTDAGTNDNWQPTIAVTPDGMGVGVFWNDRRSDPANKRIEYWGRSGAISGSTITFGLNFQISNASYPPVFGADPVVNATYMGDYDHAAADNSNYYLTWGDNRLGNPDVRFAKVPLAGPGAVLGSPLPVVSGGNGNATLEIDECANLTVTVTNNGTAAANNVSGTLTTTTPGVTILDATQPYPNIAPAGSGANAAPFRVSVPPSFVCGNPIDFTLTLTYTGGSDTVNFSIATSTAPPNNYTFTTSAGNSLTAGGTLVAGSQADDAVVNVPLPFPYKIYGQSFNSVGAGTNGNLQFTTTNTAFTNTCPIPTTTNIGLAIIPHWDDLDLRTTGDPNGGIYTSTSGAVGNRIFTARWQGILFGGGSPVNFEVRLFEASQRFDFIYGTVTNNGLSASIGVQRSASPTTFFTQFSCNTASLSSGLGISFTAADAPCPTGGGACAVGGTCVLTCPPPQVANNNPGLCCAVVNYPAPTTSGTCGAVTCSPPAGTCFPVGTTTVTCSEPGGASCTFTVTVNDTEAPVITCPQDIIAVGNPGDFCVPVNFTVTASDNCAGVTIQCVNNANPSQIITSGFCFPTVPHCTTVRCTATDAAANTAVCTFDVCVFDVCMEDDADPTKVLLFDSFTGDYIFCCGSFSLSGTGTVKKKGGTWSLTHTPPDRRVQVTLDILQHRGSANLQFPVGTPVCTIQDRDTRNNSCQCGGGVDGGQK
jgi:hypothetical protein